MLLLASALVALSASALVASAHRPEALNIAMQIVQGAAVPAMTAAADGSCVFSFNQAGVATGLISEQADVAKTLRKQHDITAINVLGSIVGAGAAVAATEPRQFCVQADGTGSIVGANDVPLINANAQGAFGAFQVTFDDDQEFFFFDVTAATVGDVVNVKLYKDGKLVSQASSAVAAVATIAPSLAATNVAIGVSAPSGATFDEAQISINTAGNPCLLNVYSEGACDDDDDDDDDDARKRSTVAELVKRAVEHHDDDDDDDDGTAATSVTVSGGAPINGPFNTFAHQLGELCSVSFDEFDSMPIDLQQPARLAKNGIESVTYSTPTAPAAAFATAPLAVGAGVAGNKFYCGVGSNAGTTVPFAGGFTFTRIAANAGDAVYTIKLSSPVQVFVVELANMIANQQFTFTVANNGRAAAPSAPTAAIVAATTPETYVVTGANNGEFDEIRITHTVAAATFCIHQLAVRCADL